MAKEKSVENRKLVTVKFSEPQKMNGSEISELVLDFSNYKGKDIIELQTSFRALYREYVPMPNVDVRYQAMVAGYVSKTNPADLAELDGDAFEEVCAAVRNFIIK